MTINGNPKAFELSKALSKNGATATATNNTVTAVNVLDFNNLTKYQSISSNDGETITLIITFEEPTSISRLFLLNHNFKSYTITPITSPYLLDNETEELEDESGSFLEDDGSILEFLNVISLFSKIPIDGLLESDYSLNNSYYEFDKVYCSGITINVTEAQQLDDVPNQEKFCYMILPTIEVDSNNGTFEGFPLVSGPKDFNAIQTRILNSKFKIQKQIPVMILGLFLTIGIIQSDIELMEFLRYTDDDFLFWPNGGKLTESYFRFNSTPYKIENLYQMQVNDSILTEYFNNIYSNYITSNLGLVETI